MVKLPEGFVVIDDEQPRSGVRMPEGFVLDETPDVAPRLQEVGLRGAGKILPTFMTGQIPAPGERTLLGNIFERPGAAVREAIRAPFGQKAEAFTRGAAFPEKVEPFQYEALRKLAPKTESVALNFLGGLPVSAGGMALDVLTNPSDLLTMIIGKAPTPQSWGGTTIEAIVSGSRPVKALKQFANRPIRFPNAIKVARDTTDKVITTAFMKAVNPSLAGKTNLTKRVKYTTKMKDAVKTIVENQHILQFVDEKTGAPVNRLPRNLDEFSIAIHQMKKFLYDTYDDLLSSAGEQGARIDLSQVAQKLQSVIDDPDIKAINPKTIRDAKNLRARLNQRGLISAKSANNMVEMLNQGLGPAYKRQFIPKGSPESVRAIIADNLRSVIDKTVDDITGKEFQVFKNKYSALRTIEEDVNKAAFRYQRGSKGFLDRGIDIYAIGTAAQGVASRNPSQVIKGAALLAAKTAKQHFANPNRLTNLMFENVDRMHIPNAITIPNKALSPSIISEEAIKMAPQLAPFIRQSIFKQGQEKK